MANQEHLERLMQGVEVWNAWQEEKREAWQDLREADLHEADLKGADLSFVFLSGANLSGANLGDAKLIATNLGESNLKGANLNSAWLHDATLSKSDLRDTNLTGAHLVHTQLDSANLSGATLGGTFLAQIDLRSARGLTAIYHEGRSQIELFSVLLPQDGSALHFLRGVGVPNAWIEDYRTRMMLPIQYHSLFISYSTKDDLLAQRLYADLQASGVRCWFAPEDLKIGDKFRQRIDEAIHAQDKLLLLLSKDSINSAWVEREVEAALEKEDRQKRLVLFPIRLDDAVMTTSQAWAATFRRMRHIGDFTNWEDPHVYKKAFDRLLRDLKMGDKGK